MKNIKTLQLIIIILISSITYNCKAQQIESQILQNLTELNSNILGTWINEEDSNWKLEFTATGKCYWYYTNEDTDIYTYSILLTSPQCGQEVKIGGLEDFYLKMINQNDFNDEYCYEILGVNSESLSISTISIGVKTYYFNKQ